MSSLVSHCIFVGIFLSLSYFAHYCCSTQNPCEVSYIATCLIAEDNQSCGAHAPILKYFGSQSYTLWVARVINLCIIYSMPKVGRNSLECNF
jgi:hypothetical protein